MAGKFTFNRELLIRLFFFTAFAFLIYQVFLLAQPFLPALLVSAMLSITLYPWYLRVRRYVKNPNLAALIMTLATIVACVFPFVLMGWFVIQEAHNLIPTVQSILHGVHNGNTELILQKFPTPVQHFLARLTTYFSNLDIDLKPIILQSAQQVGLWITSVGTAFARNAVFILFKVIIMVISLFFAFKDGEVFLKWALGIIPMEPVHKQAVAKRAYETFRAVTSGVFLTAAAQGFVAMIGFLVAGVHLPVLLGFVTGMFSLLGASFLVTLPAALLVFKDSTGWGIFLFLWGAIAVGWLDNVLKPVLIGSRARMPFVLVFFSILGGLKMYGLLGLILGPILIASLLTFVNIYRETYESTT